MQCLQRDKAFGHTDFKRMLAWAAQCVMRIKGSGPTAAGKVQEGIDDVNLVLVFEAVLKQDSPDFEKLKLAAKDLSKRGVSIPVHRLFAYVGLYLKSMVSSLCDAEHSSAVSDAFSTAADPFPVWCQAEGDDDDDEIHYNEALPDPMDLDHPCLKSIPSPLGGKLVASHRIILKDVVGHCVTMGDDAHMPLVVVMAGTVQTY